jgi:metallo-beta-lactamase family protein
MFQGLKELRQRNWDPFPIDPKSIDAAILTHAHIDHTGYLPRLIKLGFRGPIYCTPATRELCEIMLPDSGHLQEEDARYANKKGHTKHAPAQPLYTEEDGHEAARRLTAVGYGQSVAGFRFHPSGHILGAAFVEFQEPRLVISGDVGGFDDPVMRPPARIPQGVDTILVECTYGGRSSENRPVADQFRDHLQPILRNGGVVVIPAFAVGRTTLVLYHLRELEERRDIPDVPVFVDSPMATDATNLYVKYATEHNLRPETVAGLTRHATFVRSQEDSKKLNDQRGPAIIISSSGMATGGRVSHHLKQRLPDPKNLVLLVGYQAIGTRGRAMLERAPYVKIHGQEIPVRAKVAAINGLSAHGDAPEIVKWLRTSSAPKKVYLVHGEPEALRSMGEVVGRDLRWPHHAPNYLERVTL